MKTLRFYLLRFSILNTSKYILFQKLLFVKLPPKALKRHSKVSTILIIENA